MLQIKLKTTYIYLEKRMFVVVLVLKLLRNETLAVF